MAKHNDTGRLGEQAAAAYLQKQGFEVLHQNRRIKGGCEVDIIAKRNGLLHFVEVKTRSSAAYGHPEEAVDTRRQGALRKAATIFLEDVTEIQPVQFDIVAVLLDGPVVRELLYLEDCFS